MKKRAAGFWRLRGSLAGHWLTTEIMKQTSVISPDKEYSLCENSLEKSQKKWMAAALSNQQQPSLRQGENRISSYHIIMFKWPVFNKKLHSIHRNRKVWPINKWGKLNGQKLSLRTYQTYTFKSAILNVLKELKENRKMVHKQNYNTSDQRKYKNSRTRCVKLYMLELLKDLIPRACLNKRKTERRRLEAAGVTRSRSTESICQAAGCHGRWVPVALPHIGRFVWEQALNLFSLVSCSETASVLQTHCQEGRLGCGAEREASTAALQRNHQPDAWKGRTFHPHLCRYVLSGYQRRDSASLTELCRPQQLFR